MNNPRQNSAPSTPETSSTPRSWAMQTAHNLGVTAGRALGTVAKIQPTKPGAVSRAVSHVGNNLASTPTPTGREDLSFQDASLAAFDTLGLAVRKGRRRAKDRQRTGRALIKLAKSL